jgi:ATP-binding cassette subfamily F protein uup
MNLLLAENLSYTAGEKLLFADITFGIDQGQKTALIARNGTGKTTLLNVLAGVLAPDSGRVSRRNDLRMAYLPQNPPIPEGVTIADYLFSSGHPASAAISSYETALAVFNAHPDENATQALADATTRMDAANAWDFESRVREVADRLGLGRFDQLADNLSGGQRKKVALAAVLLAEAEFLILDEPTNHLDIEMTQWLENYLSREKLTLLVVTHDRYFLDGVCNDLIELDGGRIYRYKGGYSDFLSRREERLAADAAWREKALNLYRSELEWMRRMPQARATKARSREDAFYELEDKLQNQTSRNGEKAFSVNMQRMGRKILELNSVCKAFGSLQVLENFSYIFKRGEKIGVVGRNGAGKTTLLRLIMGQEHLDSGTIDAGETVAFGYFEQDGLKLPSHERVIDLVKAIAEEVKTSDGSMGAPQFLNYFGFGYDVQFAPYAQLSGGERRKLSLLITLMKNPNFLILDEPTNDLDIQTLNLLEDFLLKFQGCVLVVSHDRYFLDRVADHLFVLDGQGALKDFPGNYTAYREWKKEIDVRLAQEVKAQPTGKTSPARREARATSKPTWAERKEYEQLTAELEMLGGQKATLTEKLSLGNGTSQEVIEWSEQYARVAAELDEKEFRWLELDEKMG